MKSTKAKYYLQGLSGKLFEAVVDIRRPLELKRTIVINIPKGSIFYPVSSVNVSHQTLVELLHLRIPIKWPKISFGNILLQQLFSLQLQWKTSANLESKGFPI